jgi:hypothetical protein|tara:strand:+ start:2351 stop:2995 length:645 start_codon:yes stop_codon:yes gene_type:complete
MNRRKAIKNLGLSLGTISLTPAVLSLLQSCQNDLDWNPVFFDSNQIKFISEITNLIIPSSEEVPGSNELNLIRFIDLYISNVRNNDDHIFIQSSLVSFIENYYIKSKKNSLINYEIEELDEILKYFFKSDVLKQELWVSDFNNSKNSILDGSIESSSNDALSFYFLKTIRDLTITAFKGSEYIGKNILAFRPVPGQQKGCVDLLETTNGRAWTI